MRNTHVSLWHLGNSKLFLSFPEGIQKREPKKKNGSLPPKSLPSQHHFEYRHWQKNSREDHSGPAVSRRRLVCCMFSDPINCHFSNYRRKWKSLSLTRMRRSRGGGHSWVSHTQWPAAWSHQSLYFHFPLWETWSDRYSACPPSSCLMLDKVKKCQELSTWDFQVEEVRGSNISLKLLWLQLLKFPWKFCVWGP